MLRKYSVRQIVKGQIQALCLDEDRPLRALVVFFGLPLLSPVIQYELGLRLSDTLVSIDVSAAAIFAGLLLNLLVLVYGLAPPQEGDEQPKDAKAVADLRSLVEVTFYNISYSVFICGLLVAGSLLVLTGMRPIGRVAELFVYYFGAQLLLSVLLILRLCHGLLEHRLTPRGRQRGKEADALWAKSK